MAWTCMFLHLPEMLQMGPVSGIYNRAETFQASYAPLPLPLPRHRLAALPKRKLEPQSDGGGL